MALFSFFRQPDINEEIEKLSARPEAVLVDVRTTQEYMQGHIPGSINIPLQTLDKIEEAVDNEDTPLFVYCQSGARSRQASALLKQMGYTNVTNIGGIAAYRGKVER